MKGVSRPGHSDPRPHHYASIPPAIQPLNRPMSIKVPWPQAHRVRTQQEASCGILARLIVVPPPKHAGQPHPTCVFRPAFASVRPEGVRNRRRQLQPVLEPQTAREP